jgi:phospholipid/cholesterol/gamma-HCH transport system ATP-binding protein
MGMMFQSSALFTDLSVFDNVAFPLRVHTELAEDSIRDLVLIKLNAVGLRGARDLLPNQLSGGMARRVALARAIALDPDLLMYDEPFTGQDPIAMGVLVSLIKNLNQALNTTSLLVSHDIHETVSIADKIYVIADGKVIGEGAPDVLASEDSSRIRQFMHGSPDGPVPFHYPADDFLYDILGDVSG